MADTEHSEFRRSGIYEMPTPPPVLRQALERLCFQHGYTNVQAKLTDIGIEYGAVSAPSVSAPTPQPTPQSAPQSAPQPAHTARSTKRSDGAKVGWRMRHAIDDYMAQHPDVSRDEASRIVRDAQPGARPRTRATAEEGHRQKKGERGWDTRIKQKIILAEQAGAPIDWEEGRRRVVEDMRERRRTRAEAAAAAAAAAREPSAEDASETQPPDEEQQQETAAAAA